MCDYVLECSRRKKGRVPARAVSDFLYRDLPTKVRVNGIGHYEYNLDTIVGVRYGGAL